MSIADRLSALAARVPTMQDQLDTEEATKNALVMPFIAALGYDVFNPAEVVPEYVADVGIKKGEKVDYAICRDGKVVMIFEAKKVSANLNEEHASQLYRYFSCMDVRIGVLTNGVEYRFFSDLEEPNKMDSHPFLVVDLSDLREEHFPELEKLGNDDFDLEAMMTGASDLKDLSAVRNVLEQQFVEPEEQFIRWLYSRTNPNGRFSASVRTRFTELGRKGLGMVVSDRVDNRLRSAVGLGGETVVTQSEIPPALTVAETDDLATEDEDNGIVTTAEEIEGFNIVRAIACKVVDVERVAARDTKNYFGILLDDNNRKPICRLHFNAESVKYLVLFDENKVTTKHLLDGIADIYRFADEICVGIQRFTEVEVETETDVVAAE